MHNPWITRGVIQLKIKIERRRGRIRRERGKALENEITTFSTAMKNQIKESKHKYFNVTMHATVSQTIPQNFRRYLT